jgi:hypothetical protein
MFKKWGALFSNRLFLARKTNKALYCNVYTKRVWQPNTGSWLCISDIRGVNRNGKNRVKELNGGDWRIKNNRFLRQGFKQRSASDKRQLVNQ